MTATRLQKLSMGLWHLRQSGSFCDTMIVVSGNITVHAHAAVLASASAHLCSLLQVNHLEDNQERYPYHLDVGDYDHTAVELLLELIYTGDVTALTSTNWNGGNDLVGLCTKFGIAVDDNSFRSCLNAERCRLITRKLFVGTTVLCGQLTYQHIFFEMLMIG